jgi:hypothetical protein
VAGGDALRGAASDGAGSTPGAAVNRISSRLIGLNLWSNSEAIMTANH